MKFFRSRAGESCVVTGGAGGIGAASASLWLRCGGCAVIADVDAAAGAAFVARAPGPGRAVFVACDARRREDLENAIAVAKCAYFVLLRIISCFSLFFFPLLFLFSFLSSLLPSPWLVLGCFSSFLSSVLASLLPSPWLVLSYFCGGARTSRTPSPSPRVRIIIAYYYPVFLSFDSLFSFSPLFSPLFSPRRGSPWLVLSYFSSVSLLLCSSLSLWLALCDGALPVSGSGVVSGRLFSPGAS